MWTVLIIEDNHNDAREMHMTVKELFDEGTVNIECLEYAFQTEEKNANDYLANHEAHVAIVDGHYEGESTVKVGTKSYNSSQLGAALIQKYMDKSSPRRFFFVTGYLVDNHYVHDNYVSFSNHQHITPIPKNFVIPFEATNEQGKNVDFIRQFKKYLREIAREIVAELSVSERETLSKIKRFSSIDLSQSISIGNTTWELRALLMGWWNHQTRQFCKPIPEIIDTLLEIDLTLEASRAFAIWGTKQITHNNAPLYYSDDPEILLYETRRQVESFRKLLNRYSVFPTGTPESKEYQKYQEKLGHFAGHIPERDEIFSEKLQDIRKRAFQFKSSIRKGFNPDNGQPHVDGYFFERLNSLAKAHQLSISLFLPTGEMAYGDCGNLELNVPIIDVFLPKFEVLFKSIRHNPRVNEIGVSFLNQPLDISETKNGYQANLYESYMVLATQGNGLPGNLETSVDPPTVATCFNKFSFFGHYYLIRRKENQILVFDCTRSTIKKIPLHETSDLPEEQNLLATLINDPWKMYTNYFVFKFFCYKPIVKFQY